jgi:hypothetical protein
MIHIVNVSGGLASFEALRRTIERHGTHNTVALFADTLIEDDDLYRFLDDQEKVMGIAITRLADGRTPFDVWIDRRMIKRIVRGKRLAQCSLMLKKEIIDRHIDQHYANVPHARVFGYTWDEGHRQNSIQSALAPVPCWFPLSEPPYVDKCDIAEIAKSMGIVPPRLYELGFSHNNCGGGCVWAGQAHWSLLWRKLPDVYARWETEEQRFQQETGTQRTILQGMSLQDFRTRVLEPQLSIDEIDFGGCGCFSSAIETEQEYTP